MFQALDPEHRLAALAAVALGASIFLPWWRDPFFRVSYVGFRRITFIEIAVLLVAVAVAFLIWRRAEGPPFHLPLSDGTLIAAAGVWTAFLVVLRMLDPPTRTVAGETMSYGLRWGALVALASAAALAVAGVRMRRRYHRGGRRGRRRDAPARALTLTARTDHIVSLRRFVA